MGGIGITELLLILFIVVLLFGTKKLKNIGSDLGGAINNFRRSMREGEREEEVSQTSQGTPPPAVAQEEKGRTIEGQITDKQTSKIS